MCTARNRREAAGFTAGGLRLFAHWPWAGPGADGGDTVGGGPRGRPRRAMGGLPSGSVALRVGGGRHDPVEEVVQGVAEAAVQAEGDADAVLGDVAGDAELALGFAGDLADGAAGHVRVVAREPAEHLPELRHEAVDRQGLVFGLVLVGEPDLAVPR